MTDDYLTVCTCDCCGATTLCVLFHCEGTPVLAECRECQPSAFEAVAREEISTWLGGQLSTMEQG